MKTLRFWEVTVRLPRSSCSWNVQLELGKSPEFITVTAYLGPGSSVAVSCGRCNKWPQTLWLKTTKVYHLTAQRSDLQNQRLG